MTRRQSCYINSQSHHANDTALNTMATIHGIFYSESITPAYEGRSYFDRTDITRLLHQITWLVDPS